MNNKKPKEVRLDPEQASEREGKSINRKRNGNVEKQEVLEQEKMLQDATNGFCMELNCLMQLVLISILSMQEML